MTLDSRYQKIAYLEQLRDLLSTLYGVKDERSNEYRAHKHRLDGFIHAGLHIKLATHKELQEVVESEHIQAFGMTRKQRRLDLRRTNWASGKDWSQYDKPAYERANT
ncbi:hypothetical protein N9B97_01870 [Porticoccaceae bacterium]|nr:hypothetical protein [Porticoccaceae bacterium]